MIVKKCFILVTLVISSVLFAQIALAQTKTEEDILDKYTQYADPALEPFDTPPTDDIQEVTAPCNTPTEEDYPEDNSSTRIKEIMQEAANATNCTVTIYCNDDEPDDEWALRLDGILQSTYRKGKSHSWAFNLEKGEHQINVDEVLDIDNQGNYSIRFEGKCKVKKGPPTDPFNSSEQEHYNWVIEVE